MGAKLIGIVILLAGLVILAIQNYHPVTLRFLFWTYETNMVLTVLASFLIGFLVGGLGLWIAGAKREKSRSQESINSSLR